MAPFRVGTIGYAYKDWAGVFYPPNIPHRQWLEHYASQFGCVELNTTFHAAPSVDRINAWAGKVGPEFRFSLKMSRSITHDRPLRDGIDEANEFVRIAQHLRDRLGPILIQLPPTCKISQFDDLHRLLAAMPTSVKFAVEFRHDSWLDDRVTQLLRDYNAAWVGLDHLDHPLMRRLRRTSDFLYVRLVGRHNQFGQINLEQFDATPQLQRWHRAIQREATADVREIWIIINNDFAGYAPATIARFCDVAKIRPNASPVQHQLFAN